MATTKKKVATKRAAKPRPNIEHSDNLDEVKWGPGTAVDPIPVLNLTIAGVRHEIPINTLCTEVKVRAAYYGLYQKLRAARNPDEMLRVIRDGTWPSGRGPATARVPLIVEAMETVSGESLERCRAKWAELDKAGRASVRNDPLIKAAIAAIKAERSSTPSATKALFEAPATGDRAPEPADLPPLDEVG